MKKINNKKKWLLILPIAAVLYSLINFFGTVEGFLQFLDRFTNKTIAISDKNSILHEIQVARNTLDYTLAQRKIDVRNRPAFKLELYSKVSAVFADNPQLKTELTDLYNALSSAQESAIELRDLISKRDSNSKTIQIRENQIMLVIQHADVVGLKLANTIGEKWEKPPDNLTPEALVKYYENKPVYIYSASSDDQVNYKWRHKDR